MNSAKRSSQTSSLARTSPKPNPTYKPTHPRTSAPSARTKLSKPKKPHHSRNNRHSSKNKHVFAARPQDRNTKMNGARSLLVGRTSSVVLRLGSLQMQRQSRARARRFCSRSLLRVVVRRSGFDRNRLRCGTRMLRRLKLQWLQQSGLAILV